ncbi:hypothetical protein [Lewinella sp. JB7]|uniref:hypothetical protein n=1 Tax=Lewinella sp. JB7 TaxID=2962887 RepID=UPI0020C99D77|nr:hypothetical protein [Lewinella sp. JB7]MCP9234377.1 hypothetical protein [Lewinella sp. JB7]
MFFQSRNRFTAYTEAKQKITFSRAYTTLDFENSAVVIPKDDHARESLAVTPAMISAGVGIGYRFLTDQLARRKARFVHRDEQRATNLQAGSFRVPKITYTHFIVPKDTPVAALRIGFEPLHVRGTNTYVYQLTSLELTYGRAKTSDWSDGYDYTLQLTLYSLNGDDITERALGPLTVQSVGFGRHDLTARRLYSSPIPLEKNACLIEASLTVVETNPALINTSEVLDLLVEKEETIREKLVNILTQLLNPR